jgi:hypothetical protein
MLGLIVRIWLIQSNPVIYHNDAYKRLFHSNTLFIGNWLPVLQGLLYLTVHLMNLDLVVVRYLLATVAALAGGSLYFFVSGCANRTVACLSAVLFSVTPIFLTFSITPYSEGFYYFFLFAALAYSVREERSRAPVDTICLSVLTGLACLTRYEGWILAALLALKWVVARVGEPTSAGVWRLTAKATAVFGWAPVMWLLFNQVLEHPVGYLRSTDVSYSVSRIQDFITGATATLPELLGVWSIILGFTGLTILARRAKARGGGRVLLFCAYIVLVEGFVIFFNPYTPANLRRYLNLVVLLIIGTAEGITYIAQRSAEFVKQYSTYRQANLLRIVLVVLITGPIALTSFHQGVKQIARFNEWGGFRIPYDAAKYLRDQAKTGQTVAVLGELRPDTSITPFQMISVYLKSTAHGSLILGAVFQI